jgi:hypothetical protein
MKKNKNITYPQEDTKKQNQTIQKLKGQLRKLKKENKELKSENKTLLDAWIKTECFLEEITHGVPLEEIIHYKKLPKKAVRKDTPKDSVEDTRKKWADWRKENL